MDALGGIGIRKFDGRGNVRRRTLAAHGEGGSVNRVIYYDHIIARDRNTLKIGTSY